MNYVISDVGRPRKKYPSNLGHKNADQSQAQERFLTLAKYHELARRIIGKFAPVDSKASMLASEDAIDFVAHHIMRGDWSFEPSRGNKISTLRGYNGRVAILEYIKAVSNQRQEVSIDYKVDGNRTLGDVSEDPKAIEPQNIHMERERDQETRDYIRGLLNALSPVQRACVALHYLDDVGQSDIAKMMNMTREGVRQAIAKGMQKLHIIATESIDG
jgi:RNA polymerase sigma factor (sigma-70 family)